MDNKGETNPYSTDFTKPNKAVVTYDGDPDTMAKIARGDIAAESLPGAEGALSESLVVDYHKKEGKQGLLGRWLGGEAGTDADGWLLTVCSQIGQIMLVMPNAFTKMGFSAALPLALFMGCTSVYTCYLLVALYCERKARLVKAGIWYGPNGERRVVSQYHETMGFFLGSVGRYIALTLVCLDLLGTNIAQIIASSSDVYYWYDGISKRVWSLIWGAIFQCVILLPNFRHFRILNILGIIGTTYTALYVVIQCGKHGAPPGSAKITTKNLTNFYTGVAVVYKALGNHVVALEIMDSMFVPQNYRRIYVYSYYWIALLTIPHSTAVTLAFPDISLANGNVYAVMRKYSNDAWLKISIFLMILHQAIAFAIYFLPLAFIWEKLIGVHTKPFWVRVICRLPLSLFVWFIAIAFPFYGTINSLIGALASPGLGFILPTVAYTWTFRKRVTRDNMAIRPPKWMLKIGFGTFAAIFAVNIFIAGLFLVNGTGLSLAYSIIQFKKDVQKFKVFAKCYQC